MFKSVLQCYQYYKNINFLIKILHKEKSMEQTETLIKINNLVTSFRIKDEYFPAVDNISLELRRNEILAIVGESGCGKSTLATSIIGLHNPINTKLTGEINFEGKNLVEIDEEQYNKIRGNKIGMIF